MSKKKRKPADESHRQSIKKSPTAYNIPNWVNIIGVLLAFWTFLYPKPYVPVILCSVAYPLLCLLLMRPVTWLLKLEAVKKTVITNIFFIIFFNVAALFIRSLRDFDIYENDGITKYASLLTVCLCIMALLTYEVRQIMFVNIGSFLFVVLLITAYSYSALIIVNCSLDREPPARYQAAVMEKYIHTGSKGSKFYYFELSPWGDQTSGQKMRVKSDLYKAVTERDSISISFYNGLLHIPWYKVAK